MTTRRLAIAIMLSSFGSGLAFGPVPATVPRPSGGGGSKSVKLNNGQWFPSVSFGLWVWPDNAATQFTLTALEVGYRNFFASVLAFNQRGFAAAVKQSNVSRSELYICGSVNDASCGSYGRCYEQTLESGMQNLLDLELDYLDMIMLDYPANSGCEGIRGQWAAFEVMLRSGSTKAIAVSNFDSAQLGCITSNASATPPAVNQMPFSAGQGGSAVIETNLQHGGVVVQAYSPLRRGALASNELCKSIGAKHGKTAAQAALRWIIQSGATFTTSSTNPAHLQEDLDVFDWALTDEEMTVLGNL